MCGVSTGACPWASPPGVTLHSPGGCPYVPFRYPSSRRASRSRRALEGSGHANRGWSASRNRVFACPGPGETSQACDRKTAAFDSTRGGTSPTGRSGGPTPTHRRSIPGRRTRLSSCPGPGRPGGARSRGNYRAGRRPLEDTGHRPPGKRRESRLIPGFRRNSRPGHAVTRARWAASVNQRWKRRRHQTQVTSRGSTIRSLESRGGG